MSWGVEIIIDHEDGYTTRVEVVDGHTYNLTPIWVKAGLATDNEGTRALDGKTTAHIAPLALQGLIDAWVHEDEYRELDPPNGWGDYDGFIEILTRLTRLCHQHPRGRSEVERMTACLHACAYYAPVGVHAPGCLMIVTPAVGEAPAQVTTAGSGLQPLPANHLVPGAAVRVRLAVLCLLVPAAATLLAVGLAARVGGAG